MIPVSNYLLFPWFILQDVWMSSASFIPNRERRDVMPHTCNPSFGMDAAAGESKIGRQPGLYGETRYRWIDVCVCMDTWMGGWMDGWSTQEPPRFVLVSYHSQLWPPQLECIKGGWSGEPWWSQVWSWLPFSEDEHTRLTILNVSSFKVTLWVNGKVVWFYHTQWHFYFDTL